MAQYVWSPKRVSSSALVSGGGYTAVLAPDGSRTRICSAIVLTNGNAADVEAWIFMGASGAGADASAWKVTVPANNSVTYTNFAALTGPINVPTANGVYVKGGHATNGIVATVHYLEDDVSTGLLFTPKFLRFDPGTTYSVALSNAANKRRIITNVIASNQSGGDNSIYFGIGTSAPANDGFAIRLAGINPAAPSNFMQLAGVPLHMNANDNLYIRDDSNNGLAFISYEEEQ